MGRFNIQGKLRKGYETLPEKGEKVNSFFLLVKENVQLTWRQRKKNTTSAKVVTKTNQ